MFLDDFFKNPRLIQYKINVIDKIIKIQIFDRFIRKWYI